MIAFFASLSLILFCNNKLLSLRILISIGISNESLSLNNLAHLPVKTVAVGPSCFCSTVSNFFGINQHSFNSHLFYFSNNSFNFSNYLLLIGHLFSRSSLVAQYYGSVGCVGLSYKHKGYKINLKLATIFHVSVVLIECCCLVHSDIASEKNLVTLVASKLSKQNNFIATSHLILLHLISHITLQPQL